MAEKPFRPQIMSGQELLSGHVVYLTAAGDWSRDPSAARIAAGPDEAAQQQAVAQAQEAANVLVNTYPVEVEPAGGAVRALHFRERMRLSARPSFWE